MDSCCQRRRSIAAITIKAAGSFLAQPFYEKWAAAVFQKGGAALSFEGATSAEAIQRFQLGLSDLGVAAVRMDAQQLSDSKSSSDIIQLSVSYGALCVTSNLPNYKPTLNLTGAQLAGIYLGQIAWWDDPSLLNNNPGLKGTHLRILAFYRNDGAAHTYTFSRFLAAASDEWRAKQGAGFAIFFPVGDGRSTNPTLLATVRQNKGAIAYTDLAYAKKSGAPCAAIVNPAGHTVEPTIASISAAVTAAAGGDLTNAAGDDAYPMVMGNYLYVHRHQQDAVTARAIAALISYGAHAGQGILPDLGFVPISPAEVQEVDVAVKTIGK